jgi:hypothetical protein
MTVEIYFTNNKKPEALNILKVELFLSTVTRGIEPVNRDLFLASLITSTSNTGLKATTSTLLRELFFFTSVQPSFEESSSSFNFSSKLEIKSHAKLVNTKNIYNKLSQRKIQLVR